VSGESTSNDVEPPIVADAEAVRSFLAQPLSVDDLDAASLAFAPSGLRTVLTPRAWPPSAPPPTVREVMIDQAVAAAVADYLASRAPSRELPADGEQVAETILHLLQQCQSADPEYGIVQAERVPAWKAAPAACDLVVQQHAEGDALLRTGVLVLTASRATAIEGYFRRLATEVQPFDRLFLVTEPRPGPRALEYLKEAQQRSTVQLHALELAPEEYAELSGLQAAVRQARGGSLSVQGERVTEAEVIASHHRRERYLASSFLSTILFDAPSEELLDGSTSSAH